MGATSNGPCPACRRGGTLAYGTDGIPRLWCSACGHVEPLMSDDELADGVHIQQRESRSFWRRLRSRQSPARRDQ